MIETKIADQVVICTEKTFSTGSTGYHGVGKIFMGGKKYQANVMLIEIGSKPGGLTKKKAKL